MGADLRRKALHDAVHAVFQNDLRRRMVLMLLDKPGGVRYTDLRRATDANSNDQFQKAVQDLLHHVVIDRHLKPENGDRMASILSLSPRGQRIARGLTRILELKGGDEMIHTAIATEIAGHYTIDDGT